MNAYKRESRVVKNPGNKTKYKKQDSRFSHLVLYRILQGPVYEKKLLGNELRENTV